MVCTIHNICGTIISFCKAKNLLWNHLPQYNRRM